MIFSHDVFHIAKAQTMQIAVFFCCEKFCPLLLEDSVVTVFDVDSQDTFFFPDGDGQLLFLGLPGGFDGVFQQVTQNDVDVKRMTADVRQAHFCPDRYLFLSGLRQHVI